MDACKVRIELWDKDEDKDDDFLYVILYIFLIFNKIIVKMALGFLTFLSVRVKKQ
jgi:hypothetical protein